MGDRASLFVDACLAGLAEAGLGPAAAVAAHRAGWHLAIGEILDVRLMRSPRPETLFMHRLAWDTPEVPDDVLDPSADDDAGGPVRDDHVPRTEADHPGARLPSDPDVAVVSEVFASLASPVRVAIIDHLDRQDACVHDLVRLLGLPQPQISQHLRVLRSADLVVGTRRGREVTYALADEHVAHIVRDALVHARESARA